MTEVFNREDHALTYDVVGDPSAPPVVLLHGLSGARTGWAEVVEALAGEHRVYAVDQRGHGESSRMPGAYRVEHYADDAAAFIEDVIGGEPVALVGHSLGGLVTAHLAGTRPELVRCAFLEDPPLYLGDKATFDGTTFAQIFPVAQQVFRELRDRGAAVDDYAALTRAMPALRGEGTVADQLGEAGVLVQATTWMHFDPEAFSPAIDGTLFAAYDPARPMLMPVRLLRAEPHLGAAFLPEHVEPFLASHPDATVDLVVGATHLIHDDEPEQFIADLRAFLAR